MSTVKGHARARRADEETEAKEEARCIAGGVVPAPQGFIGALRERGVVSWPAQQPQLPNDNLADRVFVPIAAVVLACLEPPFCIGLFPLGQELSADLC